MALFRTSRGSFAGLCILIVLAAALAGCTSQNASTNTPSSPTVQPLMTSSTPTQVLPSPTSTPSLLDSLVTTVPQTAATATQMPEKISLTINSAQKQKTVYTSTAPSGRMFLVLDVTVKNNGITNGYDLTDDTVILNYAKPGTPTEKSITTRVRGGLENPILTPTTIQLNDERSGQIVFSVADTSNKYTINLIDDKGAPVSSAPVTL